MMLRFVFCLLLCSCSFVTIAQNNLKGEYRFRHYSLKSGLPSSETYDLEQDNEGNIWIATDRGVVRYDGSGFKTYTTKDGLTENVVLRIYKDYKGRLWFLGLKRILCYYDHGKIKKYKFNYVLQEIAQVLDLNITPEKDLFVSNKEEVYISMHGSGSVVIDSKGKWKKIPQKPLTIQLKCLNNDLFWSYKRITFLNPQEDRNPKPPYETVFFRDKKNQQHKVVNKQLVTNVKVVYAGNCESAYAIIDDDIYDLNKRIVILPKEQYVAISINKYGNRLWVGRYQKGVSFYKKNEAGIWKKQQTFLKNCSVTNILKDKKGGYWFSTLENGIYYLPNEAITNYDQRNGLYTNDVYGIKCFQNRIYIGYSNNIYQIISNSGMQRKMAGAERTNVNFAKLKENILVTGAGFYLKEKKISDYWTRDLYECPNYCLGANSSILKIFPSGKIDTLMKKSQFGIYRLKAIMEDAEKKMWVGDEEGILLYKNDSLLHRFNPSGFQHKVSDMLYHPSWGRLIATNDDGLFILDKENKFIKIKGLLTDDISCLKCDEIGTLWIATKKGINYIRKNKKGTWKINCITTNYGLASNEINTLDIYKNKVYAGTKSGLSIINLNVFSPTNDDYLINLKSVTVNAKRSVRLSKKMLFGPTDDVIRITFGANDFLTKGKYRYRLHKESPWSEVKSPELILTNPEEGSYDLEVSFLTENNRWTKGQRILNFEVLPPFWRTAYFRLFLLSILLLAVYLYIRYKQKQFYVKKKLIMLEQKALFAQMNPHFIFNTLNGIQGFLLYDENDKAEYFLSKFSKLLRETLHISRNNSVPLERELSMMEKYLELEQMRFPDRFSWEIVNNLPFTQQDIRIPNMIIQPYIENSIKHGFTEKNKTYMLHVILSPIDEKSIRCEIIDNGVGRKKANEQQKAMSSRKGHISYGEKITKERLASYNEGKTEYYKSTVYDLESNNLSEGTKVEIILPIVEDKTKRKIPSSKRNSFIRRIFVKR